MGASSSSSSKSVSEAIVNNNVRVFSSVVQESNAAISQTVSIDISNVAGDVDISNNSITQQGTVNLSTVFDTVAQNAAQQNLALLTSQSAKAMQSGIPMSVVSSSATETISKTFIATSSDISSQISNQCFVSGNQIQSISVSNVAGNVRLNNNSFSQIISAMASCFSKTAMSNENVNNLQLTLDQAATSENKGFDPLSIFGSMFSIGIVIIAIIIFGVMFKKGGKQDSHGSMIKLEMLPQNKKVVQPLLIVIIIISASILAYGLISKNSSITVTCYSKLITNEFQDAKKIKQTNVSSLSNAIEMCNSMPECVAFDFIGYSVDSTRKHIAQSFNPIAIFYSSVPTNEISQDEVELIYSPVFDEGNFNPTNNIVKQVSGQIFSPSIWLNTLTSDWFEFNQTARIWEQRGNFSSNFGVSSLTASWWNSLNKTGQLIVEPIVPVNPASFKLTYNNQIKVVVGPGYLTIIPPNVNASGFKNKSYKLNVIAVGIAGVIMATIAQALV